MSDYKCIRVINKNLSTEDFEQLYKQLCNLETGIISENKQSILFTGKSTTQRRFSVDAGCSTTEIRAFVRSIMFYAKDFINGVEIVEQ